LKKEKRQSKEKELVRYKKRGIEMKDLSKEMIMQNLSKELITMNIDEAYQKYGESINAQKAVGEYDEDSGCITKRDYISLNFTGLEDVFFKLAINDTENNHECIKYALIKLGTALGGNTLESYSINSNPSIDKDVTEYTINIKVFKRSC